MTLREKIVVLQAAMEGKPIQGRHCGDRTWLDLDVSDVAWQFGNYEYRVKPEPRVIWVNFFSDGSGTAHVTEDLALSRDCDGDLRRPVKFIEVVE